MIKINLLPLESFRKTASGQLSVTIFLVVMVLAGLGFYLLNSMVMKPTVALLEQGKQAEQVKVNKLRADSTAALKQTQDFVKELVQVSSISELEERRRDQARLFMALASKINNQTSWLLNCVHNQGVVTIKGMATDHETVADFLSRLENMPLLYNVELQRAAGDQVINGVKLVTFDIRANTIFPEPTLIDSGLPDINFPNNDAIRKLVSVAAPDLAKFLERTRQATTKTL
ncbi:MAG: PilN domain-containing protein [Deltaproteobacteria bacterium]|jgi:Tfp pilus assembly protein PilN|nr:PilN domain-containing protein [Deltaproteobacteria bacterium]